MIGSPTLVTAGTLQSTSNTLPNMSLKTFWTLIECDDELKMSGAFIALANLRACLVISFCSSCGSVANMSYLVPMRNANACLLRPRTWRYHSLTLVRVDRLDRSNMKRMTIASLQTRGSIEMNSLSPPRSQMEKVTSAFFNAIDFSIKFTPRVSM